MNNNCICSQYEETYLIIFQQVETEHWQLIECYQGISKKHVPSKEDNLILLGSETLKNGLTVASEYAGCPYCNAKSIFICGNCHLTRNTKQSITDAGFDFEQISERRTKATPSFVKPTIFGVALNPA